MNKSQERLRKLMREYDFSVEATVRNGFPVVVFANIHPAEPDVGIMSDYIEDFEVVTTKYGRIPFELSVDDQERIKDKIFEDRPTIEDRIDDYVYEDRYA